MVQEQLDAAKANLRGERERISAARYMKDATDMADSAEASLSRMNEAELPFLKGIEVLPIGELRSTIKESEAAAEFVQKALAVIPRSM